MTTFAYTTVLAKLTVFLDKIRTIGIPEKATQSWLETLGYKQAVYRKLQALVGD